MLKLKQVSFTYQGSPKLNLSNCNLSVSEGEFVLLCGKSGCGKSTLTKVINGIIPSQTPGEFSGEILMKQQQMATQPIWRRSLLVGSVFQNPKTQFFNLDTVSELVFGLENIGMPREKIRERLQEVVSEYELGKLMDQSVFALSGGEKQKIAIASAYMGNPLLYVLDEPSANLDRNEIEQLRGLLKKWKKEGKTVVIAEHRVWYLADLLDRAVYMEEGRIIKEWSSAQFQSLTSQERANYGLRSISPVSAVCRQSKWEKTGLQVKGLHITRNKKNLWNDLSFCAARGQAVAICGENGRGKTTLAQVLCGLRRWKQGEIYLNGRSMTPKLLRQNSFLIMQDVNHQLFAESVLAEARLGNGASEKEALHALQQMQLDTFAQVHPQALSGGQKQRLAVVDGCLCQKEILIFDEPTSGLDLDNMKRVSEMIQSLLEENKIVILITHDMEFVANLGAAVII